ncbi:MAG: hypothetical protein OR995_08140 [Candidatus Nanopelagicales bacterium]|nr:hypothetical protein [Candidatus Nanopelagicales bacterium]
MGKKSVSLLQIVTPPPTSGPEAAYTVYSLANNVISMIHHVPANGNMTNKKQKTLDQLSKKAAARWVN